MMLNLKHFTPDEFQKACPPCTIEECCEESLLRLDHAREIAGIPFIINSAYRSRQYELSKGRSGDSAHVLGRAFDIRCRSNAARFLIVRAALAVGFTRIGIGSSFIHLDDSDSKQQNRIWLY